MRGVSKSRDALVHPHMPLDVGGAQAGFEKVGWKIMTQMVHPKMGFYTILHNISIIIHSRDLFFILTFVNIFLHFITPALFTSTSHLSSCTLNWVTNSLIDSMLSSSHLLRMTRTGYTYTTLPHPTCSTKLVPGVRHMFFRSSSHFLMSPQAMYTLPFFLANSCTTSFPILD